MIVYTNNVMKYITILLLAVFIIPFVPNVNAQNIMDQLTGGIKSLTGGAGQSANNTSEQAGQAGQNMSSGASQAGQSMNSTAQEAGQNASSATSGNNTSGGGIGDTLKSLIPGQ